MPKVKTHSGAKKRFSITASGKIKRTQAFKNHILGSKSTKRKRRLTKGAYVCKADMVRIGSLLNL